ncbi:MAG: diphthamide biosynthesis enzyme Dph2, partial [Thermoplasmata archaeon]
DPCYGACDIISNKISSLKIDLIINLGHLPIPSIVDKNSIPTFYINALSREDIIPVVEKAIPLLEDKNIGLTTIAQHIHKLSEVEEYLKEKGFNPIISNGDRRIAHRGQILGCNFTAGIKIADRVDKFLFIGSGMFHPLGLRLSTKKPVIAVDPISKKIRYQEIEDKKDSILRQRYGAIALAKTAQTYGIIVGLKIGQQRLEKAEEIKKLLVSKGKTAYILTMDMFSPVSLEGFTYIDCYISTACPRIAIDDYLMYKKPILTPIEIEIAMGEKTWDSYEFDQILEE